MKSVLWKGIVASFALVLGSTLWAQESPTQTGFSGTWSRNAEESDDAEQKMQAAMEGMRERMQGRRGGGGGGGGRRGGGAGRQGASEGAGEGAGEGRRGRGGEAGEGGMPRSVPQQMTLSHEGNELHVDDGERVRIYYLDGQPHKRQMPNGTELQTVSELRGQVVHVEEKMRRRGTVSEQYELSADGDVLVHSMKIVMRRVMEPVIIRTVYERTSPDEN